MKDILHWPINIDLHLPRKEKGRGLISIDECVRKGSTSLRDMKGHRLNAPSGFEGEGLS